MKDKEQARKDFAKMIENSWTYNRMTEQEKADCMELLLRSNQTAIKGSYEQRREILYAVYTGFLAGLGYFRNPVTWREENPEEIPFSVTF